MSPSYFAGPAGHPRDDIIDRKRDAPSGLQTTLPRRPPSAPKYFCGCAGHMAIGSVPCCGTLSAVAWPRNVVHPASYFSSIVIRRTVVPCHSFVSPARRRILSRPPAMCTTTWW